MKLQMTSRKAFLSLMLFLLIPTLMSAQDKICFFPQSKTGCGPGTVDVQLNTYINTSQLQYDYGLGSCYWLMDVSYYPSGASQTSASYYNPGAMPTSIFTLKATTSGTHTASVRVYSSTGPSGPWTLRETLTTNTDCKTDITYNQPNSGKLDFTVNGATGREPQTIFQCNGGYSLSMGSIFKGTVTSYQVKVTKGTYSGLSFVPISSQTSPLYGGSTPPTLDIYAMFLSYLSGYYGYLQVSLIATGPCDGTVTVNKVYNILSVNAAVDFLVKAPNSCPDQNRHTSLSFASIPVPASTPPCSEGWLGASTAGILGYTIPPSVTISSYNLKIDRVNPSTGAYISNITDYTSATGFPSAGIFNAYPYTLGYFTTNYNTIKNNYVFKVTATAFTRECGPTSAYSYFKIIDGVNGAYFRPTSIIPLNEGGGQLSIFPNPATDILKVEWQSTRKGTHDLIVINSLGQNVIRQTFEGNEGINHTILGVESLPAGIYFFRILDGVTIQQAVFQKK